MFIVTSVNYDNDPNWVNPEEKLYNYVLAFIKQGEVAYKLDDAAFKVKGGDVLLIPKGLRRSAASVPHAPHVKYTMTFRATEEFLEEVYPFKINTHQVINPGNFDYMLKQFAFMHTQWQERASFYKLIVHGIALELFGQLAREMSLNQLPAYKVVLANRMKDFIIAHYKQPLTTDDIAKHIRRSKSYAIRVFREVMGLTPIEYMHTIRIDQARNLMLNTGMPLKEIAHELGYCDQSHLTRVFKKIEG